MESLLETFIVGGASGGIFALILYGIRALSGDETGSHDSNELSSTDQDGRNSVQREKTICSACRDRIATYINPPLCTRCRAKRAEETEFKRARNAAAARARLIIPYESYYKNGQLEAKGGRIAGKMHGAFETYYENGQLEFKGTYNMGEKCGEWIEGGETVTYDPCPPDLEGGN